MIALTRPYYFFSSVFNNPQYVRPSQGSSDQTPSKPAIISLIIEIQVQLHRWSLEMSSLKVNAIALALLKYNSLFQVTLSEV